VINQQTGCPRCAPALSLNDVYTRIKKVHGDHVVMVGKYNGTQSKTQFKCDKGHRWETTPSNVMNHQTGCAACASHGFNPSLPGILYYLKVTAPCGVYYKIGITNRSVRHRFVYADDRERIEVLKQWSYQNGHSALRRERSILKTHRAARYKGNPILKSGNTELFTHDVLGLDKGSKAPETAKNRPDDPGPANDNQIKALAA
jgi:hypothetical protein